MRGICQVKDGRSDPIFSEKDLSLLNATQAIVELLPERTPDGNLVRCHEVARIVGGILNLNVQDGKYGACDHSWLLIPVKNWIPKILDPYCVGSLPIVRIVDCSPIFPYFNLYKFGPVRTDILFEFIQDQIQKFSGMIRSA